VCPNCNKNFNIADVNTDDGYQMSPLLPSHGDATLCDAQDCEGIELITRKDDKEHIIKERLELYKQETLPILDFYKGNTNTPVIDFEAKKGKKDYPHVKEMLLEHLGGSIIP
jgi:adenylate kinase family enzyme